MSSLDPIRHDLLALARVLKTGRPTCQLVRAEILAGRLIDELMESGQAPCPEALRSALCGAPKAPEARWQIASHEYLPALRPGYSHVERTVIIGERAAAAASMATLAANLETDEDLDYIARVWADLPDEARDTIIRTAREAKP